jgi:hypothetical protein
MRRNRIPLHIEALEARDLPSNIIHIDSTMIHQAGAYPILLSQPNTTYVLDQNIDEAGSAFAVGAANVTLDLGGHTVVYGDSAPLSLVNGGFEQGTTGWNLTSAPSAQVVPAITGMYGQSMLALSNFSSAQTLVSANVNIPLANREYTAAITTFGPSGATVQLSVIDAVTGAVLASGTSSAPQRGFAAVATFTPTTTDPIKLQVTVTPPTGQTATVDLDYAAVMASRDYGVIATNTGSGNLPVQIQSAQFLATYLNARNFTIQNGHIIQGQGHGFASSALFFQGLTGFTVSNVDAYANGMDTNILEGTFGVNALVQGSMFRGGIDRISDRMGDFAAIELANFSGTASIIGNQILGVPQIGIMFNGLDTMQSLRIDNNTIRQATIVTDGYGITIAGAWNFDIGANTITPTSGRGILLDGWGRIPTQDGTIHDNYVSVIERPNLEYSKAEATALRLRNFSGTQRRLDIYKNVFMATAAPGYFQEAIGGRISEWNDQGQSTAADNLFQNNLFKAISTTSDPSYTALALSTSGIGAGTSMRFQGNILESNDTSLNFGDNDSWQGRNDDITFLGNTLKKSKDGASRPYSGIVAGSYDNEVSEIRLFDTRVLNGATAAITYEGSVTPASFQIAWQIIASGADAGGGPELKVFDGTATPAVFDLYAYDPRFMGGVRVATGDVTGDGVPDIVTAPGPGGGPDIRVFDGNTGALVREFMAFDPSFSGGTFVAVADVNGDGYADIITSMDKGGLPLVKVFSGRDNSLLYSFYAYSPLFLGGVRVAAGDINGAGKADIITAPGPGGGPDIRIFDGASGALSREWMAYSPYFTGGVYVSVGDINGDGKADIITGAGAGGGPHVEVFSGADLSLLRSFFAYDPNYSGGVRVSVMTDPTSPGQVDIVTGSGAVTPSTSKSTSGAALPVQILDSATLAAIDIFYAYDPRFLGGVFVGGS